MKIDILDNPFVDKIRSAKIARIDIDIDNNKGRIFFIINDSNITIIRSTGNISKLSLEEQKELIARHYYKLFETSYKKHSSALKFEVEENAPVLIKKLK